MNGYRGYRDTTAYHYILNFRLVSIRSRIKYSAGPATHAAEVDRRRKSGEHKGE